MLFRSMRIDSGGLFPSNKKELVLLNTGWIKAGENQIVIKRNKNQLSQSVLESLDTNGNYKISLALGSRDHTWSQISSAKFLYRGAASKPSVTKK